MENPILGWGSWHQPGAQRSTVSSGTTDHHQGGGPITKKGSVGSGYLSPVRQPPI